MTLFALPLWAALLSAGFTNPQLSAQKCDLGDPAPPLQVSEWLKGDAIPALDTGGIHVVVFWGTW